MFILYQFSYSKPRAAIFSLPVALSLEERRNRSGQRAETIVRKNCGLDERSLKSFVC
jgi:hypothetical protein